jgi:hypothetical protein
MRSAGSSPPELVEPELDAARVAGERLCPLLESHDPFLHQRTDRALDDELHQLVRRVVATGALARERVEANGDAVRGVRVRDRLVFEEPLVNGAELLD